MPSFTDIIERGLGISDHIVKVDRMIFHAGVSHTRRSLEDHPVVYVSLTH
jgi:hypothetical protein